MDRGKFITLEGSEGAGKTTASQAVQAWTKNHDIETHFTREPGGTPTAEKIRDLLLDKNNEGILPDTELLLMFAARSQHLNELILPQLQSGKWVVCDRFTDATYAYQGGGRGIDVNRIEQLENWVQGDIRPDMTLLLDLPVEVGLSRASQRSEPDRFELEKISFFERVRQAYLERSKQYPEQFRVIDASKSVEEVQKQIQDVLNELL